MVLYLPPAASVAGLSVLVAHDQDSNATFEISIYDRVWEDLQWEGSSSSRCWGTEAGVFNQELGDTFELFEKALSDHWPSVLAVESRALAMSCSAPGWSE